MNNNSLEIDKSFVKMTSNNDLEVTQNDFKKIEKELEKLKVQYTKLNAKMNRVLNEKKVMKRNIKESSKKLHEHVKNHRSKDREYDELREKYDELKIKHDELLTYVKYIYDELRSKIENLEARYNNEIVELKKICVVNEDIASRGYRFAKAVAFSNNSFKKDSFYLIESAEDIRMYLNEFDLKEPPRFDFNENCCKNEKDIILMDIFLFIKNQQYVVYATIRNFITQKYKKLNPKTISSYVQKLALKFPDKIEIKKDEKIQNKKHIILYKENTKN